MGIPTTIENMERGTGQNNSFYLQVDRAWSVLTIYLTRSIFG